MPSHLDEKEVTLKSTEPAEESASDGNLTSIGPYDMVEAIGGGGMGLVYKVRHRGAGNILALKMLRKELALDPVNVKRFQQELKTTSQLTHPNIVPIYDSGIADDGCPYFVMEYLDGLNLEEILLEEGYLDLDRFFHVFEQVSDALITSHEHKVIHRDIKPSNIMISTTDSGFELVKILDFGVARVFQQASKDGVRLTQLGEILGSPAYMSPEQCLNQKLDERSDIYALGVVMYEALAGMPPFKGDSAAHIIMGHLQDKPKSISKIRPDFNIPIELEALVMCCLEKEPADRFKSVQMLKEELKRISLSVRDVSVKAWVARLGRRARHRTKRMMRNALSARGRWLPPVAVALLMLGGGCFSYQTWLNHQSYQDYINRAEAALTHEQYDQTITNWRTALELATRSGAPKAELAQLYERAADDVLCYLQRNIGLSHPYSGYEVLSEINHNQPRMTFERRQAAREFLERARAIYKEFTAGEEQLRVLDKLVGVAHDGADFKREEGYLLDRIRFSEGMLNSRPGYSLYHEMGRVYENTHRPREAEMMLKRALQAEKLENSGNSGQSLNTLAEFYNRHGMFLEEEKCRRELIEMHKQETLTDSSNEVYYKQQLAQEIGKLSAALKKQGKLEEAQKLFEQAQTLTKAKK